MINLLKGRLGRHRFHPMLIHFPSALYPFSVVMDSIFLSTGTAAFGMAGMYALTGAVGMSVIAIIYGAIDFIRIDSKSKAWNTAGIHALLNVGWFIVYATLLFSRMKHPETAIGWIYLTIMWITTVGLFFSNYLGSNLIIKYRIGIDAE